MSRVRSTNFGGTTHGPYQWDYYQGGVLFGHILADTFTDTELKSITDNKTEHFFSLSRRGEFLPINQCLISYQKVQLLSPHSGVVTEIANPTNYYTGTFLWFQGCYLDSPVVAPSQSEKDNVVIQALAQAKAPDWDILTFIGEFHQTVDLAKLTIERFGNIGRWVAWKAYWKEIKRARKAKRPYDPQQALALFTSLWLEARYSWRPLVYDLRSALKALSHHRKNALSRKSYTHDVPVSVTSSASADYGSVAVHRTKVVEGNIRYRAVVFYRDEMGPIGANPVITAWQLTRFSFIVDWFVDISSWLQAVSPREGFTNLGVSVSAAMDITETDTAQYVSGSYGTFAASVTDRVVRTTTRSYERLPYTGVPLPSIQIHLNPLKIIDLAALAFQARADVLKILKL